MDAPLLRRCSRFFRCKWKTAPRRTLRVCTAASLLLCFASLAHAQTDTPPAAKSTFRGWDVISVKPGKTGSENISIRMLETQFQCENCDIENLLMNAFGYHLRITGIPSWTNGKRWDIQAKILNPEAKPKLAETREQAVARRQAAVQAILTERFHLKLHPETKVLPVYDLVVAKSGSKLKPAKTGFGGSSWGNDKLDATGIRLSTFADMITAEAGHPVVDKTGLAGEYDVKLRWSSEDAAVNAADNGVNDRPPTFFTALEEQLGLKLVPDRGPVTTLVVDSLDMPAED